MLQKVFFLWSLPFMYLTPFSYQRGTKRYTNVILKVHILLSLIFLVIYTLGRGYFCRNIKDLPMRIKSSLITEFTRNGCKMLFFQPVRKKKRRILLFPGLGISVRRMLQEACMQPFIEDSEIVCFQVRGLGESDWDVDVGADSMLQDALNAVSVFDSMTENIQTLFVGYSLGCFVSMQLLSHCWMTNVRCDNVLLVNGMYKSEHMVPRFKLLTSLMGVTVQPHLNTCDVPITLLHAEHDTLIYPQESIELHQACRSIGRRCQLIICDGDHNKYRLSDETKSILRQL